jgi:hypothetical protein
MRPSSGIRTRVDGSVAVNACRMCDYSLLARGARLISHRQPPGRRTVVTTLCTRVASSASSSILLPTRVRPTTTRLC